MRALQPNPTERQPMSQASLTSVQALLQADARTSHRADIRAIALRVALPLAVVAALVAAWIGKAPLAGAVIAPATVKVELNRKTVQHQEGGIVREILVRDGQQVQAGDPLLIVGDLRGEAELALLQDQLRAARMRAARAAAESRLATRLEIPADLARDPRAAEHAVREQAVFTTRRQALDEQTTMLQTQDREAREQAAALEGQMQATGQSIKLSDEELTINERLAREGFVHRSRLLGLQRVVSDYQSKLGEHRSQLASVRQRVSEINARVAQLRLQYQTQATDELREASTQVRELQQRLRPSSDSVERQTVRAPVDGEVMSLRVNGAGAVVAPRAPLLDVVPAHEKLVIDAQIAPQDIEHVRVGGQAEVRLMGGDARRLPPLPARIVFVSGDRVTDKDNNRAWFGVTVEVDAAALQQPSPVRLQPGMPAELYVTTAQRTLFEYLMKPLGLFAQRALREQ